MGRFFVKWFIELTLSAAWTRGEAPRASRLLGTPLARCRKPVTMRLLVVALLSAAAAFAGATSAVPGAAPVPSSATINRVRAARGAAAARVLRGAACAWCGFPAEGVLRWVPRDGGSTPLRAGGIDSKRERCGRAPPPRSRSRGGAAVHVCDRRAQLGVASPAGRTTRQSASGASPPPHTHTHTPVGRPRPRAHLSVLACSAIAAQLCEGPRFKGIADYIRFGCHKVCVSVCVCVCVCVRVRVRVCISFLCGCVRALDGVRALLRSRWRRCATRCCSTWSARRPTRGSSTRAAWCTRGGSRHGCAALGAGVVVVVGGWVGGGGGGGRGRRCVCVWGGGRWG